MHLHGDALGPRVPELRDRQAPRHEERPARAGPRLRELLGGHDPEREPRVDDIGAELLGGGHAALGQGAEARFASERHALLDGVERPPAEQVGGVDGVARLPKLIAERPHAVRQPLDVVIQHNLGHPRPLLR